MRATNARPRNPFTDWPRNRYADWVPAIGKPDPQLDTDRLVAVTVFTSYVLPDQGGYAATCVCGGVYTALNRQVMRREIGAHRCDEQLGHPAGLLSPDNDVTEPDARLLDRLLAGLRALR